MRSAHRAGHDAQLHIHSQWLNADYRDCTWNLKAPWSLLDHKPDDVRRMLGEGKEYLEALLLPDDPQYACVVFRAGAWCLAPSPTNLQLPDSISTSVLWVSCTKIRATFVLVYRQVDEGFLPF